MRKKSRWPPKSKMAATVQKFTANSIEGQLNPEMEAIYHNISKQEILSMFFY